MDLFGYRRIWFDIGTANESLSPIILSAGDHDGRIVAVRLWDGAAAVSGTGLIARLLFNDNQGGSGGYVEMTALAGEATAAWEVAAPSEALRPGRSTLCIEISQGTTIVCSRLIEALVEPSVIDDGSQEAKDALAEFRAAVARLEDFMVPVVVGNGGTGKTSHTANSVLTGNGTGNVKNVATKSGALYATANNGAAQFGTLPIAQGGTGATTVSAARAGLGLGNTDGALPVANGGTGQTTIAAARNALGLGNTSGALPVANGGTGSTSAAAARTALGITPANIGAVPNPLTSGKFSVKDTAHTIGTGHDTETGSTSGIDFRDSANTSFGNIMSFVEKNGAYRLAMYTVGKDGNNKNTYNGIYLGYDSTRATPYVNLSVPSVWLDALGLSVKTLTDKSLISSMQNGFEVTELFLRKFGPCVFFRTVIKRDSAIPVGTSNIAVGTLAAAYRPGFETVLDLRAYAGTTNLQGSTAVLTGSGVLQLRVGTQVPASNSLAVTGNWILAS